MYLMAVWSFIVGNLSIIFYSCGMATWPVSVIFVSRSGEYISYQIGSAVLHGEKIYSVFLF
jgi:hypothetical protein